MNGRMNFAEFTKMSAAQQRYHLYENTVTKADFTNLQIKIYSLLGAISIGAVILSLFT